MDCIAQHQHQNMELLVNAQIHKSVNFNQRMFSRVCFPLLFPSLYSQGGTQAVIPKERKGLGYFQEQQLASSSTNYNRFAELSKPFAESEVMTAQQSSWC